MVSALSLLVAGCGVELAPSPAGWAGSGSQFDEADLTKTVSLVKRVVLDWTGGYTALTSEWLGETDLSLFRLPTGETLADYADAFQESVRDRVEQVLHALEPAAFEVLTGESEAYVGDTVVHLTSESIGDGTLRVGQTKLDRCDLTDDDAIVVWAGTMVVMGDVHEFDEWVNAFANITAHEVGHTVGFFHPDTVLTDLTDFERRTEIMLAVHTLSALLGRQEFIIPQETCPQSIESRHGGVAYEIATAAPAKRPTVVYKAASGSQEVIVCTCGHSVSPNP